jgi:pimeloyl-ACP methyl ester carboxylesterase
LATFVLIHGAWHGGWCWEKLVPLLAARGHKVLAPDLPCMGEDSTLLADVSLASWAEHVAALIRAEPEPVVLVGHSRGGIVISQAAELAADRVSALIYLAAFLVPSGKAMTDCGSIDLARNPPPGLTVGEHDALTVDTATAVPIFYSGTPAALSEAAAARLCPEPGCMFVTPLQLSEDRYGRVPRAYIETMLDQALPIERQRAMQAELPCDPVIALEADHSPFYSLVEPLSEALDAIAARHRSGNRK